MKKRLNKLVPKRLRRKKSGASVQQNVPRITNETVAEHREEVLKSARKYIYPLQHSKHRIVLISSGLFILTIVAFFAYCTLALYRFQTSSTFVYRVTQVIPFPIARTGGNFIAYENYLFELRHYTHYYETQLKVNFENGKDKEQLNQFRKRALDKVVNDAYVKQLALEHNISVSDQEVNDQITIARNQQRLGSGEKVFEDVIKDYWGWTVDDFKRSLRTTLLAQKVAAKLDTETTTKAEAALAELKAGAVFADVAQKYSEGAFKDNGGEVGFAIDRTSKELSALATDALFKLQPGQTSEIINTGYTLEIYRHIETNGDKIRASRIVLNFKSIDTFVNDLKDKQKFTQYIKLPETAPVEEQPVPEQAPL
ncbi:SurA N-terminal domain-containing protein [Candidatus Saccharibacteria bacterium]|nr:SurA N-terminal domain-containing protein [Candidatus Saccharibacteria bacterium]